MVRGHQFNKVEMFQFTRPEDSDDAFDELVTKAENLVKGLGFHFRTVKLAAGDCSASMARTYDIEIQIPSMQGYKEVSSVSNARDYQARRGNIRFRREATGKPEFLHTLNGFLCAAIGFSLLDILNRRGSLAFQLSPLYLALVAFCFSMTIGVLWEFFECTMDQLFLLDMQKDTVVHSIGSVMLDPSGGNTPTAIQNITDVIVVTADGTQHSLGLGGYLDIGLLDTMKDLFVNFIGAVVFSIIGYFYVKNRGQGKFARRFIPQVLPPEEPSTKEK